jgi:hypothetical protein
MSRPNGRRAGNRLIASSNPTPARSRWRPCGAALDAVPTLMVEYMNKDFIYKLMLHPFFLEWQV